MTPRYRVWVKTEKRIVFSDDILSIDYENKEIVTQQVYFVNGLPDDRDIYCYDFDEIELMQSTGLKDKNGKEIFEGDILTSQNYPAKGVVEFRTDSGMWVNCLKEYGYFEYLGNVASSRKITGNIYENRELLEESK